MLPSTRPRYLSAMPAGRQPPQPSRAHQTPEPAARRAIRGGGAPGSPSAEREPYESDVRVMRQITPVCGICTSGASAGFLNFVAGSL